MENHETAGKNYLPLWYRSWGSGWGPSGDHLLQEGFLGWTDWASISGRPLTLTPKAQRKEGKSSWPCSHCRQQGALEPHAFAQTGPAGVGGGPASCFLPLNWRLCPW